VRSEHFGVFNIFGVTGPSHRRGTEPFRVPGFGGFGGGTGPSCSSVWDDSSPIFLAPRDLPLDGPDSPDRSGPMRQTFRGHLNVFGGTEPSRREGLDGGGTRSSVGGVQDPPARSTGPSSLRFDAKP